MKWESGLHWYCPGSMSKADSLVSWKAFGGDCCCCGPEEEELLLFVLPLRRGTMKTLRVLLGGEGAR